MKNAFEISEILKNFKMENPEKTVFGNYRIDGDKLVYRAQCSIEARLYGHSTEKENGLKEIKEKLESLKGKLVKDGKTISIEDLEKDSYGARLQYTATNEIARKIKTEDGIIFLGNGSILPLVGRTVSYGRESLNRSVAPIQTSMQRSGFIMVPFSVFEAAKLDISKFKIIEQGKEEKFTVKENNPNYRSWIKGSSKFIINRNRHFVGASLFEVDGKTFLFDVDRREIKHKIFNPFLVELKKKVSTIKDAYLSLKPQEVLKAEKKNLKVLRQGEWFFIPTKAPKLKKLTLKEKLIVLVDTNWGMEEDLSTYLTGLKRQRRSNRAAAILEHVPRKIKLQAGNNRPNDVQRGLKIKNDTYVSGKISHSGREHSDLILKGWYIAVPNTSVGSFTITGDVD